MISFFPSRAVALDLFGLQIHWYGLMYVCAFVVALLILPRLGKLRGLDLSRDDWGYVVYWAVVGVLVGGRLGFVLFYEPAYFLMHPLEIIAVWKGGMSSHGGFIGVTLALLYALKRKRLSILAVGDVIAVPVALGLAFGRFGNFINQELYGTVTSLPWGIEILGEEGLRHPTQIYAMLKDLFIAGMCYWHLSSTRIPGRTLSLFLILYAILRFLVEYLRVQTHQPLDVGLFEITRGQLLTLPVLAMGLWLWWRTGRRE